MTRPLEDVTAMMRNARALGPEETLALRRTVWPDGRISADEAGILFELNATSAARSPEWTDFFVEAITAYLVEQTSPRGYVSDENAAWLMQRIDHDGRVDSLAELELLVRVIERAENVPETLKTYALVQVRDAVLSGAGPTRRGGDLKPGSIGAAEVALLRRLLYAAGGDAPAHISRAEAELLFAIKDATLRGENAPEWQALFVQALRLHIMADPGFSALRREEAARLEAFMADTSSSVGGFMGRMGRAFARREAFGAPAPRAIEPAAAPGISPEEKDWLQTMFDIDGELDPLERALLEALAHD